MSKIRRAPLGALMLCAAASANAARTEAVEFYNTLIDHYFVTTTATEALGIEQGAAGPGWVRTGRSFPAWTDAAGAPPDARPVCRFYSSGANSHFYTASASECASLQAQEALERNAGNGVRGWAYEGVAFYIQEPGDGGACPAATTALTRVYNNGFANGQGSNHRFVDEEELLELMRHREWVVEGAVMCAQSKAAGGTANLPATVASFETLEGTWTGDARWKSQNTGMETRATEPLSLTIDADGIVTGSGFGCTFEGEVVWGDGFRSLHKAALSASGCTVPSFDGAYLFAHLERHSDSTLRVLLKRGDGPVQAMVDAVLTGEGSAPPSPPAPPAALASIPGEWSGTVAWRSQQNVRGEPHVGINVHQALDLSIAEGGALTGTGFGCTFTGSLTLVGSSASHASGTVEASGCTEPVFNGVFSQAMVTIEGTGQLRVHLGRQSQDATGQSQVLIEGPLVSSAP